MASADWPEIVVQATPHTSDTLEQWLFSAGAVSVTFRDSQDQPILEPEPGEMRLWDELTLVGLFAQATDTDSLHSALHLAAATQAMPVPDYQLQLLMDSVWERTWMQDYKPMRFGKRLWIVPSHTSLGEPDAITINLDPGLAFGTGTHATTAQCLQWLGELAETENQPLAGQCVLDYGCGSGVLAIAAAILGAASVYAVDIDHQALLSTRQNADANHVSSRMHILSPGELPGIKVDLLMANILFEPLHALAGDFSRLVASGGALVMSGVLEEQVSELRLRYNQWFDFTLTTSQNGWALLSATRRPD